MRLDKYLKVTRVIKRRTLAKEVCDCGGAFVNERQAKAGTEIKPGDIIQLNLGSRKLKFEVLFVKENVPAREAGELYKLLEDSRSQ